MSAPRAKKSRRNSFDPFLQRIPLSWRTGDEKDAKTISPVYVFPPNTKSANAVQVAINKRFIAKYGYQNQLFAKHMEGEDGTVVVFFMSPTSRWEDDRKAEKFFNEHFLADQAVSTDLCADQINMINKLYETLKDPKARQKILNIRNSKLGIGSGKKTQREDNELISHRPRKQIKSEPDAVSIEMPVHETKSADAKSETLENATRPTEMPTHSSTSGDSKEQKEEKAPLNTSDEQYKQMVAELLHWHTSGPHPLDAPSKFQGSFFNDTTATKLINRLCNETGIYESIRAFHVTSNFPITEETSKRLTSLFKDLVENLTTALFERRYVSPYFGSFKMLMTNGLIAEEFKKIILLPCTGNPEITRALSGIITEAQNRIRITELTGGTLKLTRFS